jgi:hypothetical protein
MECVACVGVVAFVNKETSEIMVAKLSAPYFCADPFRAGPGYELLIQARLTLNLCIVHGVLIV